MRRGGGGTYIMYNDYYRRSSIFELGVFNLLLPVKLDYIQMLPAERK